MSNHPQKPVSVPAAAKWVPKDKEWAVIFLNEKEEEAGPAGYWREDGSLVSLCYFNDGKPHGTAIRYHESGEVSQVCFFQNGLLEGERIFYRSASPTTEKFVDAGDNVHKIVFNYKNNSTTGQRCFNGQSEEVLIDGSPIPKRPENVPAEATIGNKLWMVGQLKDNTSSDQKPLKHGLWKVWNLEGTLLSDTLFEDGKINGKSQEFYSNGKPKKITEYKQGQKQGLEQKFDEEGQLRYEAVYNNNELHGDMKTFDQQGHLLHVNHYENGIQSGPCQETYEEGYFVWPGTWVAKGQNKDSQRVDCWEMSTTSSNEIYKFQMGKGCNLEELLSWDLQDTDFKQEKIELYQDKFEQFLTSQNYQNALYALIRFSSKNQNYSELRLFLTSYCWPVTVSTSQDLAQEVHENISMFKSSLEHDFMVGFKHFLEHTLNTILGGAAPAAVMAEIAIVLDTYGQPGLAQDFINCSLHLKPECKNLHFTAGLITMNCAHVEKTQFHMNMLKFNKVSDKYQMLKDYCDVVFRPFDKNDNLFKTTQLTGPMKAYEIQIEVDLETLNHKITGCMGWLQVIRNRILDLASLYGDKETLLPLLWPDYQAQVDENTMTEQLEHFERIALFGIPDLIKEGRKIWAFLTVICHACGIKQIGTTTEISKNPDFQKDAAVLAVQAFYFKDFSDAVKSVFPPFQFLNRNLDTWTPFCVQNWLQSELDGAIGAFIFLSGDNQYPGNKVLKECYPELFLEEEGEDEDETIAS